MKSGGVAPFLCAAAVVFCAVAASSAALAAVTDDGVSLVGEGLKISFAGASDGFGIRFLENCISDPVRFGGKAAGKSDFWQLVFVMDGGADLSKAVCVVNAGDVRRTIRFAPVFENDPVLLKVEGEEPSKLGKDGSLLSLEIPPQGLALLVER